MNDEEMKQEQEVEAMSIVIENARGGLELNSELEHELDEAEEFVDDANANYSDLKRRILESMLAVSMYSGKTGKYTVSVVCGKDTIIFDTDAFIMKEPDDIVEAFTDIKEVEVFDAERFKNEHPDIYKTYCTVKHDANVDTGKLEKSLPNVYKRYTTIIPSKKEPSLRIVKAKGGK